MPPKDVEQPSMGICTVLKQADDMHSLRECNTALKIFYCLVKINNAGNLKTVLAILRLS